MKKMTAQKKGLHDYRYYLDSAGSLAYDVITDNRE